MVEITSMSSHDAPSSFWWFTLGYGSYKNRSITCTMQLSLLCSYLSSSLPKPFSARSRLWDVLGDFLLDNFAQTLRPEKLRVKKLLSINLSTRPQYDREHSVDEVLVFPPLRALPLLRRQAEVLALVFLQTPHLIQFSFLQLLVLWHLLPPFLSTVDCEPRLATFSQSLDVSRPVDPAIVSSLHVGPTTKFLQTLVFAYDYSLHDRLLTTVGPTSSLSFTVGPITESRSIIDPIYGSSLHDRPSISVGPTSTLAHSDFFDPLLDLMLVALRAGVFLDDPVDFTHFETSILYISSTVLSDTSSPVQMGTHKQGHFRRSLYSDMTGLDKRQGVDGFFSVLSGVPQRVIAPLSSRPIICSMSGRRDLFEEIHQVFQIVDGPWLVGGDFNVIAHDGEWTGVNTYDREKTNFCDMMECGLTDAGFFGSLYTWHNKKV
ncbi:Endonuclease/exonuclease/phosphatase superfamily [Abeliophyllum distichum]|uniref:Endonuclease/exonuclease/phosphatase superfamily n=1 Tax=Abeliophyllum distichum TaxID=126358 RepID=A0ABD1RST7_9LAMI